MEYFGPMQYRGFDDPDEHEDPESAQARVFLGELEKQIAALLRRMQTAPSPEARQSLNAELTQLRRYVERIHRRFPDIAIVHHFRPGPPGSPAL